MDFSPKTHFFQAVQAVISVSETCYRNLLDVQQRFLSGKQLELAVAATARQHEDLGHNLVCTSASDCSNESKRQKLVHESPCKAEKKVGKGKRRAGKREEKPNNGVVNVRARRGQATDGHNLAERVRREKINNKLRYLKELVPGCHEGKGMSVMLDEIINYICSLQHQVEFLSMELAVASSPYRNLEINTAMEVQVQESFICQLKLWGTCFLDTIQLLPLLAMTAQAMHEAQDD
ncbi:hypothetical protein L6164_006492 [Bauhinia variegata]|uniref:Uncharacterized protein n=1 Tax=Bauhinia variegata TaxID=167791 RepID=A0ACB9PWF5_BAUVA|nr:hypothetical protein L6164_006492 [Bauhinia variegata]